MMAAPAQYFADSVDELFEYSLRDLDPTGMVGTSIHKADNQQEGSDLMGCPVEHVREVDAI